MRALRLRCGGRWLALPMLVAAAWVQAEPEKSVPPLFSVELAEEFPHPRETFDEARKLILDHYYSSTIDEAALYRGAIDGMLRLISPPHNRELSRMFSPDQYEQFADALTGTQSTIGAKLTFNRDDGSLTVTEITPGSPADGVLQVHDRIMRIGGSPLKGLSQDGLNRLLDGPPGTQLQLTVVRDIQVLDLPVVKDRFKTRNLLSEELPDGVRYLRIKRFYQGLAADLMGQLQAGAQPVQRLIIDLRGNPGGVFAEGLRSAEVFIGEKGVLALTQQRPNKVQRYVSANPAAVEVKAVVLVDKQTASSAEILAAALRDHGMAQLVGTATFGKASLERTFLLQNGYRMKFIIAAMYSPRGTSWFGKGLLPDFHVETAKPLEQLDRLSAAARLQQDLPLATAWKLLRSE